MPPHNYRYARPEKKTLLWQMTVTSQRRKRSSLLLRRNARVLGHSSIKVWVLLLSNEQRRRPWIRSCLTACVDHQKVFGGTPMDGMAQGVPCGNWRSPQNSCSLCACVIGRPLTFRGNRRDEVGGGEQRLNLTKHG